MLLFSCHTPAHEVLYRQVFLPSLPEGFEVRSTVIGIDGPGDYLSDEFLRCIRAKLDLVARSVAENPGEVIVWSDVDIRFFDLTPNALMDELETSACDILFQRESPRLKDVNTGFFVCRCTPAVLDFFATVRSELESHPDENEQMVVNRLLFIEKSEMRNGKFGMRTRASWSWSESLLQAARRALLVGGRAANRGNQRGSALFKGNKSNVWCGKYNWSKAEQAKCGSSHLMISWGYLPPSFYARTHGWPPPRQLAIYHGNYTKGADAIGQKLAQFSEISFVRRWGFLAWLWSVTRRIPRWIFLHS